MTEDKTTISTTDPEETIKSTDPKETIKSTDQKTKVLQIQSERKLEFTLREHTKKRFGFASMDDTGAGSKFGML